MQAPHRRIDPGVVDTLLDEPHRFESVSYTHL